MRPVTQEQRAVGAILDLVVDAVRAQQGDDPTLEGVKEFCRQACKIVAAIREPRPKAGKEAAYNRAVPPGRHRLCSF